MKLAPVVIFTFNRLNHTKKTIEALRQNYLACDSEVFIFSDGPRNNEEFILVKEVREYLLSVEGFKSIKIIESNTNKGLARSVIDGVTSIINKYGSVIVLEDDLVSSRYFLKYMNDSLNLYKNRKDIWSISGYAPNIEIPNSYNFEVYITKRGSSWGWATWKDRWNLNDWEVKDYSYFKNDHEEKKRFNKGGSDLTPMLNDQIHGRINSWAIRWVYSQFKHNMVTVYPTKSLIKNIGNDLTGTHTPITEKYDVELSEKKVIPNINLEFNSFICENFKSFYDLRFSGYVGIVIKKIGLYRTARRIRNKIMIKKYRIKL